MKIQPLSQDLSSFKGNEVVKKSTCIDLDHFGLCRVFFLLLLSIGYFVDNRINTGQFVALFKCLRKWKPSHLGLISQILV